MKVIQDALLYNKIDYYNKGVQRSPFHSVKGCTHSLKHLHHSRCKMFGRTPKRGSSLPPLDHITVDQCWADREPVHHDAWCEYWRSSLLVENNSVSRGQNAGEHSDSTQPTSVVHNPLLNSIFCHQKARSSLIKIGKGRIWDLAGDVLFPVAFKATIPTTIPTVTMTNPRHC